MTNQNKTADEPTERSVIVDARSCSAMHTIHAPNHGRTPGDRQFIVVVIDMRRRMLEETFRNRLYAVDAAAGRVPARRSLIPRRPQPVPFGDVEMCSLLGSPRDPERLAIAVSLEMWFGCDLHQG